MKEKINTYTFWLVIGHDYYLNDKNLSIKSTHVVLLSNAYSISTTTLIVTHRMYGKYKIYVYITWSWQLDFWYLFL